MSDKDVINVLLTTLKDAQAHLEYCSYGDNWERECARDAKLPERIAKAVEIGDQSQQGGSK